MKKVFLILMILLMVNTFPLFSDSMKIVISNYEIEVPQGWMAQYTQSPNLFFLYSPVEPNDTFQENCNLTIEALPTKYTVKQYIDANVEALKTVYTNLKIIKSEKNYHIIAGKVGNTDVKQMQFFYIKDKTALILTFTSTPSEFDKYEKKFREIASTFKY